MSDLDEEGELVFLFVVDVAGSDGGSMDLIKNCLLAALEGIPRGSLFGLVTVSGTIGVFDLGGSSRIPVVRHIVVPEDSNDGDVLGIQELLPLSHFLVPYDDAHEEVILGAIESLHRLLSPGRRAVGAAVRSVVDYFGSFRDLRGARVGLFLSGRPNYGVGSLVSERLMDIDAETRFYDDLARRAASLLTIDLFCVTEQAGETMGLASLKFLPLRTGGVLVKRVNPQDLYRMYQSPVAIGCEMVLRTSPDVEVSNDYCQVAGGAKINLCSPRDSFSFDFDFTSSSGTYSDHIVVQVAFAYSVVVPSTGKTRRFLRIITSRAKTSLSWRMVYPAALVDVQLTLLVHRLIRLCFDENVERARSILKQWLHKLNDQCAENNVTLGVFASLKDMPRIGFALMQSPFLRSVISADDWVSAQVLVNRLPPRDVLTFVYPQVTSWSTVDKMQTKGVHLNRLACSTTQCHLFVLDALNVVIIRADVAPPRDSAMRQSVEKLRSLRLIGPEVVHDATGQLMDAYLIEEQGLKAFLDEFEKKK